VKLWCPEWNSGMACAQALITYSKYKHMLGPGPCGALKGLPCPRVDDWKVFRPENTLDFRSFMKAAAADKRQKPRRLSWRSRLTSICGRPLKGCWFSESYTVIYENIIPAVCKAVIDLFMKTAIVLRSVGGSQTPELFQVEVIVLWMQWNRSLLTMCTTKEKQTFFQTKPRRAKLTQPVQVKNSLTASAGTLLSFSSQLSGV